MITTEAETACMAKMDWGRCYACALCARVCCWCVFVRICCICCVYFIVRMYANVLGAISARMCFWINIFCLFFIFLYILLFIFFCSGVELSVPRKKKLEPVDAAQLIIDQCRKCKGAQSTSKCACPCVRACF